MVHSRGVIPTAAVPATIILLVMFVSTAGVGLWAAYDRTVALEKLVLILIGFLLALVMGWYGYQNRATTLRLVSLGCLLVTLVLSVGYLTHVITDSDLVASSLILVLPFGASALAVSSVQGHRSRAAGILIVVVTGLAALALSPEWSAWAGLLGGGVGAALWVWRFELIHSASGRRWMDIAAFLTIGSALAIYLAVVFTPAVDPVISHLAYYEKLMGRVILWRDTLPLIQDYLLTGSGLGSPAMVYSTYVYLLHVPYIYHAHNLYLQIAVEQGALGLTAFCAMGGAVIWGMARLYPHADGHLRAYIVGVIAACSALIVYGLFDSEIYVTYALPTMFIPVGIALAAQGGQQETQAWPVDSQRTSASVQAAKFLAIACLLLVLAVAGWFGLRSSVAANLGAVAQTRAELSVYQWPEWPLQDALRRSDQVDLGQAEAYYAGSLALDSNNVTAHRRLGQIALARGDYAEARRHLEQAHSFAPGQRATRQMLGEIYALTGATDKALWLWQDLDVSNGQLDLRLWWYRYLERDLEAQHMREMVALFDKSQN